jgi:hypothetical protein
MEMIKKNQRKKKGHYNKEKNQTKGSKEKNR